MRGSPTVSAASASAARRRFPRKNRETAWRDFVSWACSPSSGWRRTARRVRPRARLEVPAERLSKAVARPAGPRRRGREAPARGARRLAAVARPVRAARPAVARPAGARSAAAAPAAAVQAAAEPVVGAAEEPAAAVGGRKPRAAAPGRAAFQGGPVQAAAAAPALGRPREERRAPLATPRLPPVRPCRAVRPEPRRFPARPSFLISGPR